MQNRKIMKKVMMKDEKWIFEMDKSWNEPTSDSPLIRDNPQMLILQQDLIGCWRVEGRIISHFHFITYLNSIGYQCHSVLDAHGAGARTRKVFSLWPLLGIIPSKIS